MGTTFWTRYTVVARLAASASKAEPSEMKWETSAMCTLGWVGGWVGIPYGRGGWLGGWVAGWVSSYVPYFYYIVAQINDVKRIIQVFSRQRIDGEDSMRAEISPV